MASISRELNGRKTIQFIAGDGRRRSIRLGKVSQRIAEEIKIRVEALLAATVSGYAIDNETAAWVARLSEELAGKLAAAGLIPKREAAKLGDFLDGYIARHSEVKPNTRRNLKAASTRLIEYFGSDKDVRDINAGDADGWLLWLRERYANGTAGRTVKRAKQFFRAATAQTAECLP
jgi:hypothetical protein